jgi:hypothetical protein
MTPDTGVNENGTVHLHPGFLLPGSGGILDDPMFSNANFLAPGYTVARVTVEAVPEPGSLVLIGTGLIAALARTRTAAGRKLVSRRKKIRGTDGRPRQSP